MVRVLDLKRNGVSLLELEEPSLGLIKEATFYLAKKTEQMSDEEFGVWLQKINKEGWLNERNQELYRDVFSGDFRFLQKDVEELKGFISIVLGYLFESNSDFLNIKN